MLQLAFDMQGARTGLSLQDRDAEKCGHTVIRKAKGRNMRIWLVHRDDEVPEMRSDIIFHRCRQTRAPTVGVNPLALVDSDTCYRREVALWIDFEVSLILSNIVAVIH